MATQDEIKQILMTMTTLPNCPINGDKEMTKLVVTMFHMVLKDLPRELLQAAALDYLATATFWPTPGNLRQLAIDLQVTAHGIPTPAEAWAMVQQAVQYVEPVICAEAQAIHVKIGQEPRAYWENLAALQRHEQACGICKSGGFREMYGHPVVEETVRRLGGREALMTDNPVSDRSRFIEAYREILDRERRNMGRPPEVVAYVEHRRQELLEEGNAGYLDAKRDAWEGERARAFDTGERIQLLSEGWRK